LYAVSERPVLLLFGGVTAWRAFRAGMSPGRDVAELNANLRALGYGAELTGDSFSAATAVAIESFQAAHGLAETGKLLLGSVVFTSRPVRVTSVTPTRGAAVHAGPVLAITSTARQVTITLPDNQTTPGVVSSIGSVATPPATGSGSPTIEVDVTPTQPTATGRLDQAPVNVSIVTASVTNVLVVPVNALLALAGGGYAIESVSSAGIRHLVPVTVGLFDDADGLAQVSGSGLHAGQRVVVPAS
jgi:peptidoglycan hydrolase-like protein with peptidoglycan-binding domain